MAPSVIQLDDLDKAPISLTPVADEGDPTSRAALMQIIYKLLLLIGQNMSKMQQANSKLQIDQQVIAEAQTKGAQENENSILAQLDKLKEEQANAAIWNVFGSVMKWIGAALAVVLGGLLSTTGVGFLILLAVTAFVTSPAFEMTTDALAKELVKIPGLPENWAKIISQVIVLIVVTVASAGTETATAGMKLGATIADDVVQATSVLAKVVSKISTTSATTEAFIQTLMSSSLIPELVNEIPGMDKLPWLQAVISVVVQIVIAVTAFKFTPTAGAEAGSLLSKLGPDAKNVLGSFGGLTVRNQTIIKLIIETTAAVLNGIAGIGSGVSSLKISDMREAIAPLQALIKFVQGIMDILTRTSELGQKGFDETMKKLQGLFEINFSRDMEACVKAQIQG